MPDEEILGIIEKLPKLNQRQYDTRGQLCYLAMIAVKLGLYDADDVITNLVKGRK